MANLRLGCRIYERFEPQPLELSPLIVKIFKEAAAAYGPREHSPNIIRRYEEPCGLKVLGTGFPATMVDDLPKNPGFEVVPRGR